MPREQINTPAAPRTVIIDGYAPVQDVPKGSGSSNDIANYVDPALHIQWMGNEEVGMPGHVQAALEVHRGAIINLAKWLTENPDQLSAFFWTDSLTRPELQNLLRTVKRARDRVFGADE